MEVENSSATSDNTPPSFVRATLAGRNLTFTYDENLDESSVPPTTAYTFTVGGEAIEVEDVDISGQVVTVLLASTPPLDVLVHLAYNAVQDTSGNRATARTGVQLIATSPARTGVQLIATSPVVTPPVVTSSPVVTPPVATSSLVQTRHSYYRSHLSFFYNRSPQNCGRAGERVHRHSRR